MPILKAAISLMIEKGIALGFIRDIAAFLFDSLFNLDVGRDISDQERSDLMAAYGKSVKEGNSLYYEKALDSLRKYPVE